MQEVKLSAFEGHAPIAPFYHTKDYSLFKKMEGNRQINENHVNEIMESIKIKNLLFFNPVIINEKMEVGDGQHRIEAARRLNLQVYYIIAEGLTIDDVEILNTDRLNWTPLDYLNLYCKLAESGDERYNDYLIFRDILTKVKLPFTDLLKIVTQKGTRNRKDFYRGNFKMGDIKLAEDLLGRLQAFEKYLPGSYNKDVFMNAFWFLEARVKGYEHGKMMSQLLHHPELIHSCRTTEEWKILLQQIYNAGNNIYFNFYENMLPANKTKFMDLQA